MSRLARRCRVLLLALLADALAGEPPNDLHPVVWMGRWLQLGERYAPDSRSARLVWGAGWLAAGAALAGGSTALVAPRVIPRAALASTLLAYRGLDQAVAGVQAALADGDLEQARLLLGWHLVSRSTADLGAAEVAAAAIESLAENLSDSVVAPLLAYLCGDLPGMALYRFCNTADAMWGYRNQRYEQLGKAAARADDLLNLAPARLTTALLVIAAQLKHGRGMAAWQAAQHDHRHTASPNAGWPMAAMAGALDTILTKRGHYRLGNGARIADAALIGEARRLARTALLLLTACLAAGALAALRRRDDRPGYDKEAIHE